jgi:RNA polymerase sigma-70 factor (ECF subfamily)
MAESDERALLDRALEGDSEAFGELVDRHGPVIYNLVLRMTGNAEDARDLSQTVFVKAWDRLSTFDRGNRLFSWLYRIAMNEALNFRRGQHPTSELSELEPSREPGPEQCFERQEEIARVQRALLELRSDDREVIVLRHFLRLSHHDMSGVLHVPEKTVKSRLHTARLRLETELRRLGFGA